MKCLCRCIWYVWEVVDWAFAEDLYVIINIHHDNEESFMYLSYEYLEHSKQYSSAENRILVSVHAYTPYNFALAGENDKNSTDQFSIGEQNGTADIDTFMKKLYDKYISKGTGVVIGEFGARIKKNNIQARTEFAAYYVAQARHYGMTTCWWDNNFFGGDGENFGILRRVKNQILFPQIVAQMVHYSTSTALQ